MKNLVQQRHLRRVFERVIVRFTSKKHHREENEKEQREEDQTGRRKKSFRAKCRKKIHRKKKEFQNASLPPLLFRRCQGPHRQISLDVFEGLFDLHQLQIKFPQLRRHPIGHVAA
jgi:hypothetical protein